MLWQLFYSKNPELLGIYVKGSSIDQLMDQITCGDVGLERAVALPNALFPLVVKRLDEFATAQTTKYKTPLFSSSYRRDRLEGFLTSRCSKEFLAGYIARILRFSIERQNQGFS